MRTASIVVAPLLASACTTIVPPVPLPAGDPRPAALLQHWDATASARRALRGRAHLVVDGDMRVRGNQIIVLERPARLRVEVLGFLDQTAAVIATDGERFEVFRSSDRSYDTGVVHPGLLWQEIRLALTPAEAVEVLLGGSNAAAGLAPARAVANGPDRIRMDLVDADRNVRRRVAFDGASRLREIEVLDDDGEVRWRASFDDYAFVDGDDFAHTIVLDVSEGVTHVEVSLRDVELNPPLPAGVFQLRAPAEAVRPVPRAG
jgi:hypothetical protein